MADDLFEQILARLEKVSRPAPSGDRMARCPFHEDKTPSLSVHPTNGFNCKGCGVKGSLNDLAERLGVPIERKSLAASAASYSLAARGISKDTMADFGIETDLEAQAWRYPVRDQTGRVIAYRFKAFNPRRGRKFWWGAGPRLAIYGLDLLAKRFPGTPLAYLVEGEPDAWTAYECGLPALSFTDGAGHVPAGAALLLKSLGIQHVEILYDNDDAGRKGARKVAQALSGEISVGIVSMPTDLGVGGDLTDLYRKVKFDTEALRQTVDHLERIDLEADQHEDIGTPASVARRQLLPLSPWLAGGIIRRGELALLSGRADSFKSTFALELAVTVISGQPFLGEIANEAQGPVLFIQEEIAPNYFNHRLANATSDLPDEIADRLVVWNRRGLVLDPTSGSMENLLRAIEVCQPVLLIVDNLTCCYPQQSEFNENNASMMTRLFEPLKRLRDERDMGVLLLHHDRKPGPFEGSDSPRGSSVLENAPDCRLRLMRDQNDRDWVKCYARLRNGDAAEPFSAHYNNGRLYKRWR